MDIYQVKVVEPLYRTVEVHAASPAEAREKALEAVGIWVGTRYWGELQVYDVERVK